MAKLTNIRERIDDMLTFHTPEERGLGPTGVPRWRMRRLVPHHVRGLATGRESGER